MRGAAALTDAVRSNSQSCTGCRASICAVASASRRSRPLVPRIKGHGLAPSPSNELFQPSSPRLLPHLSIPPHPPHYPSSPTSPSLLTHPTSHVLARPSPRPPARGFGNPARADALLPARRARLARPPRHREPDSDRVRARRREREVQVPDGPVRRLKRRRDQRLPWFVLAPRLASDSGLTRALQATSARTRTAHARGTIRYAAPRNTRETDAEACCGTDGRPSEHNANQLPYDRAVRQVRLQLPPGPQR
jgi:hypothetical protein